LAEPENQEFVLIRGGGDLASGVALRLHHSGLRIVITELEQPLVIRRSVSFAEAVYEGETQVEDISAERVDSISGLLSVWQKGQIPVLIDPDCRILDHVKQSSLQAAEPLTLPLWSSV
jgi:xanthine dehydrogenase accessory factor